MEKRLKFGVVEYTSKTGGIWRHTAEKPNYLSDPKNELDPTSFGCYVSALHGEHIPLMYCIRPTLFKRISRKLTGYWPTYDISYFKDFDVLMIVHQMSNGHEITQFTKRIKQTYPHIQILGVPTQPYGILRDFWEKNPAWLQDFKKFSETCDVFITIVKSTLPFWKSLFPKSNVQYLPQPYPVEYATSFAARLNEKKNILFVAGVAGRDNIPKGLEVARNIQEKFPEYSIHVAKVDGEAFFTDQQLHGIRYEVIPFQPWQEHLTYLSSVKLVINTDYTFTRGRVQMDAAAVGTPSIGANSDAQDDLFASFPADKEQSIKSLITQAQRLLSNAAEYEQVVKQAQTKLQSYTYLRSAARVQDLVSTSDYGEA